MSDAFEQAVKAAERSIAQHDTGATIGHMWRALDALAAERRRAAEGGIQVEHVAFKAPDWPLEARSMDEAFEISYRRRAAALDELARVDAPLISEPPARLCVRHLEPRSVEPRHWGMF